ncbi:MULTISPECIES: phosphotransferase family protein [Ramlibacter]|uniref:Phosphotransferase n=1 Tax=Ramlibacter pinisoli TaxID=2682844 RepID=A0A6N8IQT1_9BURK|nr:MULTISPECIES: phosphotransferase [Ramlibacter]MBA2964241.1 phosphotransferase [Ramlibacter sp. CGMCC 1.13660]MVQ29207.1 phosphotransferase [Ramlibacter pinisoli]
MDPVATRIDADALTGILQRAGILHAGRVREVGVLEARDTVLSSIVRLRVGYDGEADGAPASLVLKTQLPERLQAGWDGGRQEVAFYREVAPATPPGLLPRCFDAAGEGDGQPWHLLLEDLTDTHAIATTWPLPPTEGQCQRIVRTLARFHAAWWDHARLGVSAGRWATPADLEGMLSSFEERFASFLERTGDLVTPERRRLYERLIDAGPRLHARYATHRHMTIVHGDAHVWNCFLPAGEGGGRLFDWDAWRVDTGADDLAYMIAMHWYPERRRLLEHRLLDAYHDTLLAHGVAGYGRSALDDDYRLSVLWLILRPVWQAGFDVPPRIWWNNYERILLAVDDLGCRELLG